MGRKTCCGHWTGLFRWLPLALMMGGCAGVVHADPPGPLEWTEEHIDILAAGDPGRGEQLAGKCDRCHGANGDPGTP